MSPACSTLFSFLVTICLAGQLYGADESTGGVKPFKLANGRRLGEGPAKEHSGIVKSRQWPDLYWLHNDSGDQPRIYAMHRDGSVYQSDRYPDEPGVLIGGAINVDWEDIALTASGKLVVADCGNNSNDRRDLALYFLMEPRPQAGRTAHLNRVFFRYPEQHDFPATEDDFNYDAEAVFALGDVIYVCTKHRSDTNTRLYRLDSADGRDGEVHDLTLVDAFDARGKVTGADATADGKQVVLLTYTALWLFDVTDPQRPLSGPVKWLPYEGAEDVEAVCFADDRTMLVGSEAEGRLYEVPLDRFIEFSRETPSPQQARRQ